MTGTAVYGTVRTVVWEDGGGNPASISDVYLGPVDFTAAFAERLAAAHHGWVKVEAGELIGDLEDRVFKLGFLSRAKKSVFWIDPAVVLHELLGPGHPLIAARTGLDRVKIAGPFETETPASLTVHENAGDYVALEVRKEGIVCELHNPSGGLNASTWSLFSEDELTPHVLNAAGVPATQPSGTQVTLSMTRISVVYGGMIADEEGNVEGVSVEMVGRNPIAQNVPLTIGATVRPRDVFSAGGYGANDDASTSYNLRIEHRLSATDDFVAFTFFQDAPDRLREEYRDRDIPVPPRDAFTTPRILMSAYFDARELHLQHDYNAARARFFGDDKHRHQRDLTLRENEMRAVADYVHTRYLYHLLYSATPLIADPVKRKSVTVDLRITRGFANPRKTAEFGYSRLHPRQYGQFLEFKPVIRSTSRMRALRMACADFLRDVRALNGDTFFRHLFMQFTKRARRRDFEDDDTDTTRNLRAFWKIELDGSGNEVGSASVRILDDGSIASRPLRKIGRRRIDSTSDAEERTYRIELIWQPMDLLAATAIPAADPLPAAAEPVEPAKKTSIVLLATEGAAIPTPYRLPLDDKARTFMRWLRTEYPDDNDPRLVETITLGDALQALGLFGNNEDEDGDENLQIRYLVIISHSRHETLYLRYFEMPSSYTGPELDLDPINDAEFVARVVEQAPEMLQLYRRLVQSEILPNLLDHKALRELGHASKQRLRKVFSGAEAILLTGCAPGFTKFTETHRLGSIASAFARITNTDVYASKSKVLSYAMKSNGDWRYHGPMKNSSTGLMRKGPTAMTTPIIPILLRRSRSCPCRPG